MKQKRPDPMPFHMVGLEHLAHEKLTTIEEAFILLTGAEYKSYKNLSNDKRNYLTALSRYYAFSRNGYILLEAFEVCKGFAPPAWVLQTLDDGFIEFKKGKSLTRSLHLGKRDHQEFEQFKTQGMKMKKLYDLTRKGKSVKQSAIELCNGEKINPDTIEKQYRRFWKRFFEHHKKTD